MLGRVLDFGVLYVYLLGPDRIFSRDRGKRHYGRVDVQLAASGRGVTHPARVAVSSYTYGYELVYMF